LSPAATLGRTVVLFLVTLPSVTRLKLLLIRIYFEDDPRHPLKEVDLLLAQPHQCHNDPMLPETFLMNVCYPPGGDRAHLRIHDSCFDHRRRRQRVRGRVPGELIEYVKLAIRLGQYVLAGNDDTTLQALKSNGESSVNLTRALAIVPVFVAVPSSFPDAMIAVTFADDLRRRVRVIAAGAGGCLGFVGPFDAICEALGGLDSEATQSEKREARVAFASQVAELLGALLDFAGEVPQTGSFELLD
jgi:hypothetical protein